MAVLVARRRGGERHRRRGGHADRHTALDREGADREGTRYRARFGRLRQASRGVRPSEWCHRQPVRVGPEPWTGDANAHMKDAVENFLNREVCRGIVQLVDAQREIANDWLAVYRNRGLQPAT